MLLPNSVPATLNDGTVARQFHGNRRTEGTRFGLQFFADAHATFAQQHLGIDDVHFFIQGAVEQPGAERRREQLGVLRRDVAAIVQLARGRTAAVPLRQQPAKAIRQVDEALQRPQCLLIDRGHVDCMPHLAGREVIDQQFNRFDRDLVLGFLGAGTRDAACKARSSS